MLVLSASESMNKYSTKRTSSNSFDSFSKHRRDYSPNRRSHSRNSSPDSWSPRGPSSYSSKSYSRRSKERDSKYYDSGGSKSKYLRLSRSPIGHESSRSSVKNHSSGHSKDSYYENNHSSAHSSSKRSYFGDWTEQVSSSGKRYFYNEKTEVSQWEKPKEWADWEKRHASKYSSSSAATDKYSTSNYRDKYDGNSGGNVKSYAYATTNDSYSSSRERHKESYNSRYVSPNHRSQRTYSPSSKAIKDSEKRTLSDVVKKSKQTDSPHEYSSHKKTESLSVPLKSTDSQCNILNNNHTASIRSDQFDQSSKSSSVNHSNHNSTNSNNKITDHGNVSTSSLQPSETLSSTFVSTLASFVSSGQSSLSLTKLLTQLTTSHGINLSNSSSEDTLLFIKKALNLTQKSHLSNSVSGSNSVSSNNQAHSNFKFYSNSTRNSLTSGSHQHQTNNSPTSQSKHQSSSSNTNKSQQLLSSHCRTNNADSKKDSSLLSKRDLIQSPDHSMKNDCRSNSGGGSGNTGESNAASSSLSTISAAINSTVSAKCSVPNLQRFKHLFREDLVGHVTGWSSEQLEKQAAQLSEQENHIGNHQCTRVSSELKNARSLVRLTEIQTTLQKQRILFASQQIKLIEDWKGKNFASS